jgi:hypothetical protein
VWRSFVSQWVWDGPLYLSQCETVLRISEWVWDGPLYLRVSVRRSFVSQSECEMVLRISEWVWDGPSYLRVSVRQSFVSQSECETVLRISEWVWDGPLYLRVSVRRSYVSQSECETVPSIWVVILTFEFFVDIKNIVKYHTYSYKHYNQYTWHLNNINFCLFVCWCLMPLSTIFQL